VMSGYHFPDVREAGPILQPRVASSARWLLWKFLRIALFAWNLIETGSLGSGVFTRVFLASALKP